ncbi:type I-F CRISPR-associated protein Csy2 [Marinobacterium rhizophilum]|uniref:type I-F CRISPR-associated protein Csy2 n=1 Tax=Marinobacterium rhizophilum TaxID=420402 RepID=UPI0003826F92|nr:type I-F CRISPR-associated protein Csy2 [Marinobacterium rhizophilum]
MTELNAVLMLPRLQVQNANAISGPLSWGFPSPTAFTGFAHALERRFRAELQEGFAGIGIVCHRFEPQVYRPAGKRTQVFSLTRNPLDREKTAAIVEEGRAHLEVSLLIGIKDYKTDNEGVCFAEDVMDAVQGMRLAGGSILPQRRGKRYAGQWLPWASDLEGQAEGFQKLRRRLLPGFALVQREDRLSERLLQMREHMPDASALDALMDLCRLNIEPDIPDPDNPEAMHWGIRKTAGWLAPVPVGYGALSPLYGAGEVANARDENTPFRFVESLYSLGEWIGPHRLSTLEQLFWHTSADTESGIYRCINHYSDSLTVATSGIA